MNESVWFTCLAVVFCICSLLLGTMDVNAVETWYACFWCLVCVGIHRHMTTYDLWGLLLASFKAEIRFCQQNQCNYEAPLNTGQLIQSKMVLENKAGGAFHVTFSFKFYFHFCLELKTLGCGGKHHEPQAFFGGLRDQRSVLSSSGLYTKSELLSLVWNFSCHTI